MDDSPTFACGMCGRCFADAEQIRLHIQTHTGQQPFRCVVCWPLFYDMSDNKSLQPCVPSKPLAPAVRTSDSSKEASVSQVIDSHKGGVSAAASSAAFDDTHDDFSVTSSQNSDMASQSNSADNAEKGSTGRKEKREHVHKSRSESVTTSSDKELSAKGDGPLDLEAETDVGGGESCEGLKTPETSMADLNEGVVGISQSEPVRASTDKNGLMISSPRDVSASIGQKDCLRESLERDATYAEVASVQNIDILANKVTEVYFVDSLQTKGVADDMDPDTTVQKNVKFVEKGVVAEKEASSLGTVCLQDTLAESHVNGAFDTAVQKLEKDPAEEVNDRVKSTPSGVSPVQESVLDVTKKVRHENRVKDDTSTPVPSDKPLTKTQNGDIVTGQNVTGRFLKGADKTTKSTRSLLSAAGTEVESVSTDASGNEGCQNSYTVCKTTANVCNSDFISETDLRSENFDMDKDQNLTVTDCHTKLPSINVSMPVNLSHIQYSFEELIASADFLQNQYVLKELSDSDHQGSLPKRDHSVKQDTNLLWNLSYSSVSSQTTSSAEMSRKSSSGRRKKGKPKKLSFETPLPPPFVAEKLCQETAFPGNPTGTDRQETDKLEGGDAQNASQHTTSSSTDPRAEESFSETEDGHQSEGTEHQDDKSRNSASQLEVVSQPVPPQACQMKPSPEVQKQDVPQDVIKEQSSEKVISQLNHATSDTAVNFQGVISFLKKVQVRVSPVKRSVLESVPVASPSPNFTPSLGFGEKEESNVTARNYNLVSCNSAKGTTVDILSASTDEHSEESQNGKQPDTDDSSKLSSSKDAADSVSEKSQETELQTQTLAAATGQSVSKNATVSQLPGVHSVSQSIADHQTTDLSACGVGSEASMSSVPAVEFSGDEGAESHRLQVSAEVRTNKHGNNSVTAEVSSNGRSKSMFSKSECKDLSVHLARLSNSTECKGLSVRLTRLSNSTKCKDLSEHVARLSNSSECKDLSVRLARLSNRTLQTLLAGKAINVDMIDSGKSHFKPSRHSALFHDLCPSPVELFNLDSFEHTYEDPHGQEVHDSDGKGHSDEGCPSELSKTDGSAVGRLPTQETNEQKDLPTSCQKGADQDSYPEAADKLNPETPSPGKSITLETAQEESQPNHQDEADSEDQTNRTENSANDACANMVNEHANWLCKTKYVQSEKQNGIQLKNHGKHVNIEETCNKEGQESVAAAAPICSSQDLIHSAQNRVAKSTGGQQVMTKKRALQKTEKVQVKKSRLSAEKQMSLKKTGSDCQNVSPQQKESSLYQDSRDKGEISVSSKIGVTNCPVEAGSSRTETSDKQSTHQTSEVTDLPAFGEQVKASKAVSNKDTGKNSKSSAVIRSVSEESSENLDLPPIVKPRRAGLKQRSSEYYWRLRHAKTRAIVTKSRQNGHVGNSVDVAAHREQLLPLTTNCMVVLGNAVNLEPPLVQQDSLQPPPLIVTLTTCDPSLVKKEQTNVEVAPQTEFAVEKNMNCTQTAKTNSVRIETSNQPPSEENTNCTEIAETEYVRVQTLNQPPSEENTNCTEIAKTEYVGVQSLNQPPSEENTNCTEIAETEYVRVQTLNQPPSEENTNCTEIAKTEYVRVQTLNQPPSEENTNCTEIAKTEYVRVQTLNQPPSEENTYTSQITETKPFWIEMSDTPFTEENTSSNQIIETDSVQSETSHPPLTVEIFTPSVAESVKRTATRRKSTLQPATLTSSDEDKAGEAVSKETDVLSEISGASNGQMLKVKSFKRRKGLQKTANGVKKLADSDESTSFQETMKETSQTPQKVKAFHNQPVYVRPEGVKFGQILCHSCSECGAVFRKYRKYLFHLANGCKKRFVCQICGSSLGRRESLKTHMTIHSGEAAVSCQVCGKTLCGRQSLTNHMRIHTGEKPYKCPECSKSFRQSSALTSHYRTHSRERPFKCDICDKAYGFRKNLYSHRLTHTGERPFVCHVCNAAFYQLSALNVHLKVHSREKPFACTFCVLRFEQKADLNKHLRENHAHEVREMECKKAQEEGKPHLCTMCNRGFNSSFSMRRHMKSFCLFLENEVQKAE